jgi:hypothetical protein
MSPQDVLAENLKEALKQAHRHLVFATSAALFLLLLAAGEAPPTGLKGIPILEVEVDPGLARIIAAVAYFVSGYLALFAVFRARRIMWRLREWPELREAVLMYPSIPTTILRLFRMAALLLPVLLFLAATVPSTFKMEAQDARGWLLAILLLSAPYVVLMRKLWYPLAKTKYKLTSQALEELGRRGLPPRILEQLRPMLDQEFPNRDSFIEGLRKSAGRMESVTHTALILAWASDEEVFED